MKKKNNIILVVTIFIVSVFLFKPITCYAWGVDNTSVSNIIVTDGKITSFDFQFEVPSYLAETNSWLGLQTIKFDEDDFTDDGRIYDRNYANVDAIKADDDFVYEYGIKKFSDNSFPCFGSYNIISETFSDLSIDTDTNDIYYVYLWTLYNDRFYPDILLATIKFNNGTIKISDSSENEIVDELVAYLMADVVEKIEINNANFTLKVGDAPKFTAKIENNSDMFDLVETFMALNRESTLASDEEIELVEDYEYFHISEIYIKDNVNLKFDENTKVYINGIEQKKENMYVSFSRISISDENDVIIPEGYVAPAYLDETFEDEQNNILGDAVVQAIKEGKVVYDNDITKEIVSEALENNKSIIVDFWFTESIAKSRWKHFFPEEPINAINNKIGANDIFTAYYEIALAIYVDGMLEGFVTELTTPLSVTIPYPNGIPALKDGYQRIWKIIRYHNGEVSVLDAKKTDNGISFENDKYSVLGLVYEDIKTDENNEGSTVINNPQTEDNVVFYIVMLGLSVIGLASAGIYLKKKRNY